MTQIAAFFSVLTALIAVYIAYQQYKNSSYRIKMDLFDKRFEFYEKLREIKRCIEEGINEENQFKVMNEMKECELLSKFLFNEKVSKKTAHLREKVFEIRRASIKLHGKGSLPVGYERKELANRKDELLNEIETAYKSLDADFLMYMRLSK